MKLLVLALFITASLNSWACKSLPDVIDIDKAKEIIKLEFSNSIFLATDKEIIWEKNLKAVLYKKDPAYKKAK